ncbi:MAG: DNA polymerase III subunit [Deltaproteobacteria bacterium]|nr:DNA polymerase III subunit [Deltaproteobacteria bacterium]MCL5792808.1 DNA polymerase III subunit [Deltaproteobacteria bacterium]
MSLLDIKGQQRAITIIKQFIINNTVNSSFLLYGNKGVGKHLTALNIAKTLNCEDNKDKWLSDDTCMSCRKIDGSKHTDVVELKLPLSDGEKQVDTIRNIIEWLNAPLFEGKHKTLIMDDASELNLHSQNAILKTLEEPPAWATIILITNSYTKLLPTVLSRLIKVGFNRLSVDVIKSILQLITTLKEDELNYVSLLSNGGIKYLSYKDAEKNVKDMINTLSNIVDTSSIIQFAEKFKSQAWKARFQELMQIMLSILLDAIIIDKNPSIIRNINFVNEVGIIAKRFDRECLIDTALSLEQARLAYEINVNPQMIMENILFGLIGEEHDN